MRLILLKLGTFIFPLFLSLHVDAQFYSEWTDGFAGVSGNENSALSHGAEEIVSIVVDDDQNIYEVGNFQSQQIDCSTFSLYNNGQSDIFVVRYNNNGQVLWVKGFGGFGEEFVTGLALDQLGDIVITGTFNSSSLTFGNYSLVGNGGDDLFLAKLNSAGDVIWAHSGGGNQRDFASGVAVDANNDVYITGGFASNTIQFGSKTLYKSMADADIFIAKYSSSGSALNAFSSKMNSVGNYSEATSIHITSANWISIAGSFGGFADVNRAFMAFDDDTLWNNNFVSFGGTNYYRSSAFVAAFDTSGGYIGGFSDSIYNIATSLISDNNGNFYLGTRYSPNLVIVVGEPFVHGALLKLSATFNQRWKKQLASPLMSLGSDEFTDLSYNGENIYATGYYAKSDISFATDTFSTVPWDGRYYANTFVMAYDTSGTEKWVKRYGGSLADQARSIVCPDEHTIYLAGAIQSDSVYFDDQLITNYSDTGYYEAHLASPFKWRYAKTFLTKLTDVIPFSSNTPEREQVQVYPNPTAGVLHISCPEIATVSLYNMSGELVLFKQPGSKDLISIDPGENPAGVYIVNIETKSAVFTKRIIIN